MKAITKEQMDFLHEELNEYKSITEMTNEEYRALQQWVSEGHSVYENDCLAMHEGNIPCEFLEVYRDMKETREKLQSMSKRDRKDYLARLNGDDTIDNLREDLHKEMFRTSIYQRVLRANGLLEEADFLYNQAIKKAAKESAEWMKNNPNVELPFN